MSSLNVEVVKVDNVVSHPNAHSLDIAIIGGWEVVVRKGLFEQGSLGVYFPIDSKLPSGLESYLFPPDSKIILDEGRIKTIKIRQQVSQGLLVPCEEIEGYLAPSYDMVLKEGTQLTDRLGVTKWEPKGTPLQFIPNFPRKNSTNNSNFTRFTDIEHLQNLINLFENGEEVVVTEKIHGCLQANSLIYLADGRKVPIKDVVEKNEGSEVLALDERGQVVTARILHRFRWEPTDDWLRVKFSRINLNRGNSYGSLICTPKHRFWNPKSKSWMCAEDLQFGMPVVVARKDLKLSYVQKQILIGKMLGDASFSTTIQVILSVEPINQKTLGKINLTKYDLETTANNYIANGVVVHNTNFRAGWVTKIPNSRWERIKKFFGLFPKMEFVYGSHNVQLQNTGRVNNVYYEAVKEYNLESSLRNWGEEIIIYGEIYGSGVQKNYQYDAPQGERRLALFAVKVDGRYVVWDEFKDWPSMLGIPSVPLLYEGPFSLEKMKELVSGPSVLGNQPIKEGIVVHNRSPFERRKIAKKLNPDYLIQKGNSEWH